MHSPAAVSRTVSAVRTSSADLLDARQAKRLKTLTLALAALSLAMLAVAATDQRPTHAWRILGGAYGIGAGWIAGWLRSRYRVLSQRSD